MDHGQPGGIWLPLFPRQNCGVPQLLGHRHVTRKTEIFFRNGRISPLGLNLRTTGVGPFRIPQSMEFLSSARRQVLCDEKT